MGNRSQALFGLALASVCAATTSCTAFAPSDAELKGERSSAMATEAGSSDDGGDAETGAVVAPSCAAVGASCNTDNDCCSGSCRRGGVCGG